MCDNEHANKPSQEACVVVESKLLAPTISRLTLAAPWIAAAAKPGQFIHLQIPSLTEHMLRRPLGIYRRDVQRGEIVLVVQAVGTGTRALMGAKPGDELPALGPIGHGYSPDPQARDILLVAGGIGAVPLYSLAEEARKTAHVQVILGAQTADLQVFQKDYESLVGENSVHICTDDGSAGFQGFTTELASQLLKTTKFDYIATCGPHMMQSKIAQLALKTGVTCEVSLEERMACGIGACLSCVVDTNSGKKRVCVDGPVFTASEVIW